jgi:hypothetical protein
MNHQWHACCLNEEAGAEADVQLLDEIEGRKMLSLLLSLFRVLL